MTAAVDYAASAIDQLWTEGDLTYLLHSDQLLVYQTFRKSTARKFFFRCSRRWGKSVMLLVVGFEECLRAPNSLGRYAAPTQKMVRTITEPIIKQLLNDCPERLRPKHYSQDGILVWPNGSEMHVAGTDNGGAERLRGASLNIGLADECGFMSGLDYLVQDILLPQCLTTGGRILGGSTPSPTPAHPFFTYCLGSEQADGHGPRTIYDAPHVSPKLVEEFKAESGGERSTTWRREYLAEFVVDSTRAVIPEFQEVEKHVVQEFELPEYYDAYVSLDVGFYDLSFAVLAVTDFRSQRVLIVDEFVARRERADVIAAAIDAKRVAWFGEGREVRAVADAPPMVLVELCKGAMNWSLPKKDNAEAALSDLRMAVGDCKLVIHPRCKQLIAHLRNGIWNKSKTSFERSDDEDVGHFDGIDAAKYLWRTVDLTRNPYPRFAPNISYQTHWIKADDGSTQGHAQAAVANLLRPKRRTS